MNTFRHPAPTALITGITGQDGAYLASCLLEKGYRVVGTAPPVTTDASLSLSHLFKTFPPALSVLRVDNTDAAAVIGLVRDVEPDEIYNLAGLTYVPDSFSNAAAYLNVNGQGCANWLEAVRLSGRAGDIRFYQASSSELFGAAPAPQSETTPMDPLSPYAAAKHYAYDMVRIYRRAYGLFAANGILFNHESPVRPECFVTQKIVRGAVRAAMRPGTPPLRLGNCAARRDWSHASDMAEGMWAILQHAAPDDFVLASGRSHSVREFAEIAFAQAGVPIVWEGEGLASYAVCQKTGDARIVTDPDLYRPLDVAHLCGDAGKARSLLGWAPRHTLGTLVRDMVAHARADQSDWHETDDDNRPALHIVR